MGESLSSKSTIPDPSSFPHRVTLLRFYHFLSKLTCFKVACISVSPYHPEGWFHYWFFSICASGFSFSFFLMCYVSSEADHNWLRHRGYFFSEHSLFFGPWKVWPRGERAGEEKNEIFCPCSSHALIPSICQDCILSQLRNFTGDLSCMAPALSGFCKIIHLFASSALRMILSSCMLLLPSRKFYWLLNPNTNVNFNFIKISSVESCEWNLFSIKNI